MSPDLKICLAELLGGFANEIHRVNTTAILDHLEVQVRSGCAARFAHKCYNLALLDFITNLDHVFRIMGVSS